MMNNNFKKGKIATAIGLTGLLLGSFACSTTIDPGYAGVVYNANGGLEENTLGQGWHMVTPWKSVTEYPVSTETVYLIKNIEGENDNSFNISTKEGKPVNVDAMYSYHMEQGKLPHIFTKFRRGDSKTIEAGYIKQQLKTVIQEVTSNYSVLDVYGEKRGEIQTNILDNFSNRLKQDGIIVENFSFGEIRPDSQSMLAIQAKVDAQQKLQQYQTEKQQAEVLAEKARIEAKGKADASLIEAQGKAKANQALQQSITNELIEYTKAQKWDGALPTYQGGSGTIMSLPVK
ncbi:prohibitin family protein [Brevibacillus laterosporus]|uniref:prohibitin family protein n=1 Tax=Brevibacillus laterosporus TaxID=1465 RepID=UPI002E1F2BBA|nr:prohibitin family protein [Brevibacillus laterosporus]MED1667281.1 prohibitin family protein [Brevibacillus laterosporus]MED1718258.1 prohibitin family protein [Brevibacillus laterosporus]